MTRKIISKAPFLIAIIFFIIPFTWFSKGQIDWGGDSSRLYYLDPYAYLTNHTIFGVSPSETGGPIQGFYSLPYVSLLFLLKSFLSSTTVIEIFHGLKLSAAFLFTYLSLCSIFNNNFKKNENVKIVTSIVGGILYALSPILILGWDKAIFTHDQIFLNPLMFFLFLKFLENGKFLYLCLMLMTSFTFAHNFSAGAAPALFSFYPLSFIFLLFYKIYILKGKIYWKKIIIAFFLFLGIHAFHLIPLLTQFFVPGSDIYTNVFTSAGKFDRGLSYFFGIVREIKLSSSIFSIPQMSKISKLTFIYTSFFPLILITAFTLKKNKLLILSTFTFLISLFFVTANITTLGVEIYKSLFNIPGFSMFRNFFGQWNNVFIFHYSLVVSISLMVILSSQKNKYFYILPSFLILMSIFNAYPFLKGDLINKSIWQSQGVGILSVPSKDYLDSINYLRKLEHDSKILTLPITDPGYQIISGSSGGVYQGPSTIAYLTGKRDFPGLGSFYSFRQELIDSVVKNDINRFKQILAYFNIGYIYYNSDPMVFDKGFPYFPYQEANLYFPKKQTDYKKFIDKLNPQEIARFGKYYHIYKLQKEDYLPHIFVATSAVSTNDMLKAQSVIKSLDLRDVFVRNSSNISIGRRFDIFQANSSNPFEPLYNNYHIHNHEPHISHKMNELIYPLIIYKEKLDLANKKDVSIYVDNALFLMSKRIYELIEYGNHMVINKNKALLPVGNYYMSWEMSLLRYKDEFKKLDMYLDKNNKDISVLNAQLVKIDEQIKRNNSILIAKVHNLKKTKKEKEILIQMINKTFVEIYSKLRLPNFSTQVNNYTVTIPKNQIGKFRMLVENIPQIETSTQTAKLVYDGKSITLESDSKDDLYISFPQVSVTSGIEEFSLQMERKNIVHNSNLFKGKEFFAKNLDEHPYIEEILGYEPLKQYLITFEYKTDGQNFTYSFLDQKTSNTKDSKNKFFDINLNSKIWKKEQLIITADHKSTRAFIAFANNYSNDNAKLSIRSFNVSETRTPNIIFVRDIPGALSTPKVSFQKISPVNYKISIENADKPFFLVLSDEFSSDWKIMINRTLISQKPKIAYFNGKVNEFPLRHDFPSDDLFYGWGNDNFIANNTHFVTNGYANGWYISPSDVEGERDYNLMLFYNGQKPFYIGLVISIITLATLLLVTIRSIFKN